ncbi:threonine export protein RhtC [Deinococcus seoulensis]|uniref:Threonine export protein RhtC n=2 Tax=Deinococcus TaxID=1298 RepID=A0ABQ2RQH4_9DEIO|nr:MULTISPECIES: LysE family transporter [Deinococcus]GGR46459.1 threonine export protein RhtC [Deinococcus seoulensis]GGS14831.1 threonine export protein RhtC [Deinococcus knuensis]
MDLNILLAVAAIHAVVLVIPGPDVLLVSQTALARTRRAALLAGLGVVLGIACWAALALLGIGLLFQAFPWIHGVVKVAGGAYLLWMGVGLWRSSTQPGGEAAPVQAPLGDLAALRAGFLTNISNPKAAVFFGSVFSGLLGAHAGTGLKLAAFLVIVGLSLGWFALVAAGMSTAPMQRAYLRARRAVDRVAGTLMLGFGALLLASRE